MPPSLIFDISSFDLNRVEFGMDEVRKYNPQRGHMEHLNGIIMLERERGIAFKDVRDDEFWVEGHIPGRPLLPGVILIEAAAQAASFVTRKGMGWEGFIGFGGVEKVKFRQQVVPGQRVIFLSQMIWARDKRICSLTQALVDGNLVFEGEITGVVF